MKKEKVERRSLDHMPFDHSFDVEEGKSELCHATGFQVKFPGDYRWWNEYEDSEGRYFYGR